MLFFARRRNETCCCETAEAVETTAKSELSRWLRKPCLTWIPVSHPQGSTGMTVERKFWMPYRKGFALRGMTVLFLLACFPSVSHAETCTPTPDCKSLGYTQSSCPDGSGVKCPWNISLWHCDQGKKCSDLGFSRSCTGTGYAGGEGMACDGKYAACKCSSGYIWKDGSCIQPACLEYEEKTGEVISATFKDCYTDGSYYLPSCILVTKECGTTVTSGTSGTIKRYNSYNECMSDGSNYCQKTSGVICKGACKKYNF